MGQKTLIRLLVALGVIGVIAAILHFADFGDRVSTVEESTSKHKVFKDFPLNDVAKISIEAKDASVNLVKGEKSWEVVERDDYPANQDPIVTLLKNVWDLKIAQPVTIGRSQFGRLNLISPEEAEKAEDGATILKFQDAEGKDLGVLWLGKVYERSENRPNPFGGGMATTDAGRYVKTGSSNAVFLVGETFTSADTDPSQWLDKTFFKVDGVKTIEINTNEPANDWKLTRNSASGDFVLANAKKDEKLDQTKVSSMKSAFSNPQIEDVFVGDEAKKNQPKSATFVITTFDGFTYKIQTGEKNDLNELSLTVEVSAKFQEKRNPGEEESDEEKGRLDKEFEENLHKLKEKFNSEKKLEGHVFKVRSYLVDPIKKPRSELMEEKQEEGSPADGKEVAPGISLPVPGLPNAMPQPKPAPKPKASPKAKPGAKSAPKPEATKAKAKSDGKAKAAAESKPKPDSEPKPE